MEHLDLISTRIASAGYDPRSRTMEIRFAKDGSLYRYPNVEPADFEALTTAYSPGTVFNERFAARQDHERVE